MLDSDDNDRPQRRSALVARELSRLDIDIAALSEVRFAEEGSLVERGAGYALFWSGRRKEEHRQSGVGFMIKNNIAKKLHALPTGHSDRIMSLRLPLQGDKFATLVSVYSPTLQADLAVKEAFYGDLHTVITRIDPKDKLIVLGDFNARVGRDSQLWKGVLGKHGLSNCNDNGRLLLQFCSQHQLTITNTLFQQQDRFKTTWRHPRSKHWHLLDYILVRQRDARDAVHTRVMPSADCYTDHRLVRAKLAFNFKPPPKKKGPQTKKLQVHRLHKPEIEAAFQARLAERLQHPPNPDPSTQWQDFKTAVQESAAETLGFSVRKNKDWFDESDPAI
ncbi:craniofacial development protein 2-like [Montipora foliosa]|uniref:craniofacial development protein 2-like n=1 Tax=Montipora foliosa TaxID=591990 RepID=UPI0035F1D4DA